MADPIYDKLRQKVEAALIDNGGMDFDLMTRTEESEVAEFIMTYIWPEIEGLQHDLETSRERSKHLKELLEAYKNPGAFNAFLADPIQDA